MTPQCILLISDQTHFCFDCVSILKIIEIRTRLYGHFRSCPAFVSRQTDSIEALRLHHRRSSGTEPKHGHCIVSASKQTAAITLHRKDADHAHEGRIEDTRLPALRAGSLRACRDRGRCHERTTGAHRIGRRLADRRAQIDDTRRSLGEAPVRKSPGRRRQVSRPPADRSGIPLRAR